MAEGLREVFQTLGQSADSGTLEVVTTRVDQAVQRRHGQTPAFLVTAGFESWLKAQPDLVSPIFSLRPERAWSPLSQDQVFGIQERIDGQGQITSPLKMDELEFLVSKLELLKIKHIAIGFLHSDLNPEHEIQASRFFQERGFKVTTSHQIAAPSETVRWRIAVENAYATASAENERVHLEEALSAALGDRKSAWKTNVWTPEGAVEWNENVATTTRGGHERALLAYFSKKSGRTTLHFGLESFHLVSSNASASNAGPKITALSIQPTRQIEFGAWNVPSFGSEDRGYEPGPMLFGKSHMLTLLDVLFVRDRLLEIEGFTGLIAERARPRILESFYTLGKTIPDFATDGRVDAKTVAEDLETSAIESLAGALARSGAKDQVHLTGPFAPTFAPLLKKRRPDLDFIVDPEGAWAEADAAIGGN